MGQQVNIRCKQLKNKLPRKIDYVMMNKYLKLDPETSDLIIIRKIKVRTGKKQNLAFVISPSESEPFAKNHLIDGKPLKQS